MKKFVFGTAALATVLFAAGVEAADADAAGDRIDRRLDRRAGS